MELRRVSSAYALPCTRGLAAACHDGARGRLCFCTHVTPQAPRFLRWTELLALAKARFYCVGTRIYAAGT